MRAIYIFSLFFLVFSCQHALEKPVNLLSEMEMTNVLTDIYLYKQLPDNIPLSQETAFDTYVSIFKKHNTTKEIFQDSFSYYYTDGDALQHIYDGVIENLKKKLSKEQLQHLKEEERNAVPKK